MNLAIVSPSNNTYSETFIQAHKKIKADKVFFYYGGTLPIYLEGNKSFSLSPENFKLKNLIKIFLKINPFQILSKKIKIKEYLFAKSLKKNKVDVILAEFGPTGLACLKVSQFLDIPLIVHFHGFDVHKLTKNNPSLYNELFNKASYLVGVSKEMIQKLKELGAPEEKLVYTPCGPNEIFYKTIPDRNSKKFLAVGRFVDKKAPYYTIMAFMDVLKKHPEAQLYMIGEGPLFNTCKNLIETWGLENSIHLLGAKNPEEIFKLHNESCAFIQHSIEAIDGDKEGTPVGVMEASASSLPLISTRHAGIKDVVIEGKTGLLSDEKDYLGMANNINWILENPDQAEKMGKEGREFIKGNFSLKKHINILSEIINKVHQK